MEFRIEGNHPSSNKMHRCSQVDPGASQNTPNLDRRTNIDETDQTVMKLSGFTMGSICYSSFSYVPNNCGLL